MTMKLPEYQVHPAAPDLQQPLLMVVVDTEEEFDWNQPFNRSSTSTRAVPGQDRAHEIYDRLGVVPTYVMDYAVATAPASLGRCRARRGRHALPSLGHAAARGSRFGAQFLPRQSAA